VPHSRGEDKEVVVVGAGGRERERGDPRSANSAGEARRDEVEEDEREDFLLPPRERVGRRRRFWEEEWERDLDSRCCRSPRERVGSAKINER
jgi:hypothetical protein